jgi:membrane protease YdiL (CAAX protease family)
MSPAIRNIFVNPELQQIRAGWRIGMLMLLFVGANFAVTNPLVKFLKTIPDFPVQPVGTAVAYFIVLTFSTWVMLRFVDKRPFHSVGLHFSVGWGKQLSQGLLFGSGMMSLIFVIEYASGMVVIEYRDLSLQQSLAIFANSLGLYIAVGYGEELMFRGYLFQSFVEGTNKLIATLSISLLFAAAHANNPNASVFGLINVGLAGVWLSVAYFKTKALWLPIGLHISWNFFQGFVYAYPVSGTSSDKEQIGKAIVSGPEWLTGGAFGPEGGALATLMLVIGTALILRWDWVSASVGLWSYDDWREERKLQRIPDSRETTSEHS